MSRIIIRAHPFLAGLAGVLVLVVALDLLGWPFLAGPLSSVMSRVLDRQVTVAPDRTRFHFLGGVRLETSHLRIAAAPWVEDPYFLDGTSVRLRLRYIDLWRAWQGQPLVVKRLETAKVEAHIKRLADGRGSWPLGDRKPKADRDLPAFGLLKISNGQIDFNDERLELILSVAMQTHEGAQSEARATSKQSGLTADFEGSYQGHSLKGQLSSSGLLPLAGTSSASVPLVLDATLGSSTAHFSGTATNVITFDAFRGKFRLSGPSLGSLGDILRVALPTTGAFKLAGDAQKEGARWSLNFRQAEVGRSRMTAQVVYDRTPEIPVLSGRISGQQFFLADLAPTIGATPAQIDKGNAKGRKLPDRPFDLPALGRMNAHLKIKIEKLDLGRVFTRPIAPIEMTLILKNEVLQLADLSARIAGGSVQGELSLDGRNKAALWTARLGWKGIKLEQWIKQAREGNQPPYVSGALQGKVSVKGAGRSTAEILGSLDGKAQLYLLNGRISHLAVEAAGIDLAQALGVALSGDDALPVGCGVSRFNVKNGVFRIEAAILDTPDSTLSLDGDISLANEQLDLRLVSVPKDFSPLSLRTPVEITGSLANPVISLETSRLASKLGVSALLSIITPWAALIPLIDTGTNDNEAAQTCQAILNKAKKAQGQISTTPGKSKPKP